MEYRNLGRSGLRVSVVGLGCNNLGRSVDHKGAAALVDKSLALGVNFFDCADVYGDKLAEEYLGAAVKARRSEAIVATKVGAPLAPGRGRSASRAHIVPAVNDCLRRLGTETIDLLQIHFPDPGTPIEETLRALDDLVRAGKVRYLGCCNFDAVDVRDAAWTARTEGLSPFISAQSRHNVLEARITPELARACERHGLGLLPYYPLAAGLLTGKYRPGEPAAPGTRLSVPNRFYDGMLNEKNLANVVKLEKFSAERGRSILELAIGWLASQKITASVICGATRPEQVEANAGASGWRLTSEEMKQVDALLGIAPGRP
ncbi:MAG: aldo/keto reductase [Burkholderiales bacterium]|nr:aldo/keto reductase [Burkholderiales bacterium]